MKKQLSSKKEYADFYVFLMEEVVHQVQKAVKMQYGQDIIFQREILEVPPLPEMGDCALPCFFLAKQLKQSPIEIAQQLESACATNECIEQVRALGPYLNIFFNPAYIAQIIFSSSRKAVAKKIQKSVKGGSGSAGKETIVIEYVSPNTNKPLHLGHARNAVLGDSLGAIFEAAGYHVVRASLVNDRGIHICKSMVAYEKNQSEKQPSQKKWETPQSTKIKSDHFVGEQYVLFNQMVKENEDIQKDAQECLLKWEKGDRATRALWKKMNAWALNGLNQTYKRFGIHFDKVYFESDFYTKGKDIILEGLRKGLFKEDETGAVYADLASYNLPNKILLRKDGTSLYITQDLYLAVQKTKDFRASRSTYVIGSEQDMYMKQLFAVLDILGYPWAKNLHHVSYGMVCLPDGKMKSREGTKVDVDVLLDTLEALALAEIKNRGEKLSAKEAQSRAVRIACAAVKFYLAEVGAKSDMIFNPEESLSFAGRTGPYIQYTYARVKSILRKNTTKRKSKDMRVPYAWIKEKQLLLLISQFSQTIQSSARAYDPSIVAKYIYSLARSANEYYHSVSVLSSAPHERVARIMLLERVADILKKGLALLGIETLEKM